jgi:gas vesicle protein
MSSENRNHGFFSGLLTGALIGAGIYYFLTSTNEGKKVRQNLAKKGGQALDGLDKTVSELEIKGEEIKKNVKKIQDNLERKATFVKEVAEEINKQKKFFTKNGKSLSK